MISPRRQDCGTEAEFGHTLLLPSRYTDLAPSRWRRMDRTPIATTDLGAATGRGSGGREKRHWSAFLRCPQICNALQTGLKECRMGPEPGVSLGGLYPSLVSHLKAYRFWQVEYATSCW